MENGFSMDKIKEKLPNEDDYTFRRIENFYNNLNFLSFSSSTPTKIHREAILGELHNIINHLEELKT